MKIRKWSAVPKMAFAAICLFIMIGTAQAEPIISSDFVLGPTTPGKWGSPVMGTGATVTYSFMGSGLTTDAGAGTSVALSTFMPAGFMGAIIDAFAAWSAIADITFNLVADPGVGWQDAGAGAADIRITGHAFDGAGGTLAHAFYPPNNGGFAAGDMHFDTAENWTIGSAGFDIFTVAAHEIGHAIGLDHITSVVALMNPFYAFSTVGPLADDIAGAQFIYGAPVVDVPEPATGLLLLLGMGLLVGMRRKHV